MTELQRYDERVLMQQIAEGHQQSFRTFFNLYKERLFTFVLGLTHSKVDAEEIVQDIFMKLWESRATLTSIEYPQSYVFKMARNKTLDWLAKVGRDQKMIKQLWANIRESEEVTEQILNKRETQKLINDAVSTLTDRKKQIFELSRNKGLSLDEISSVIGISKQTVKNTLSEALKQIKAHLDRHSPLVAAIFWIHYFHDLFSDL